MRTRQRVAAVAAGAAVVVLATSGFLAGRFTAPNQAPRQVGASPAKLAELRMRHDAAMVGVRIVFLRWNAETLDSGTGHLLENFTIRFEGTHPAFQVQVALVRQDWAVLDVRPFN